MTEQCLRRDLALWMVDLRRITVVAGLGIALLQALLAPGGPAMDPIFPLIAAVALYNEIGRVLLARVREARLALVANAQIALDTLALTTALHLGGGLTSSAVFLFAPAFFTYGAVLPLPQAFVHVALAMAELAVLGAIERPGVALREAVFHLPDVFMAESFVGLAVVHVSALNGLCAYLSRHLSRLVSNEEEQNRALAVERGALLARNEREAARVRALLDVAQHVSATHTLEELLHAVCDTTVALVRVPRVEIFLWDAERSCLRLAAARGRVQETIPERETRYPAELPVVARLRAGEVVQFGAAPSHLLVPGQVAPPFRRAFAAPMVCRGSFEGALFVGYDDEDAEELTALVQGIARQAALALVNVRNLERQQEDAEVSRVLLDISQGLSACLDEQALWTLVVRGASEVLGLPWSVAIRFDEQDGSFAVTGVQGVVADDLEHSADTRFRLEDFPLMQEALSSRELVVVEEAGVRPFGVPAGVRVGSWIAVPLVRAGWVAGFLTAGMPDGARPFSRRQLQLAEGLGHHASIALQNARLVADLEAADQLKTEFVSTMSHELRTPLNVIIGYTEMLREGALGPVTPGQLDLIDRLDSRGRELLELIEATLHVGRLEAGRDTLEVAPIELAELVQALQASTAGLPRPPAVALEWEAPLGAPHLIVTDRAKVALVVRNLVSNALKFTAEGRVVVRLAVRGDTLAIEVRDTGIGIGAEHLPLIFDMFRQVDGSMTRRHGGVGLGLYIVKQFTKRLGGMVSVTSRPGRGSCFRVELPRTVRLEDARASAA